MLHSASTPAEKVLYLANGLPQTRDALIAEAERADALLQSLPEPCSEYGRELNERLAEVFLAHIDAIEGLLEYDESGDRAILEDSLALLLESDRELEALESLAADSRQDIALLA
jgi:hypothetical protein